MAYCSGLLCFWGGLRSCLPEGDVVVLLIASSPIFLVLLARVVLRESIPASFPLQMALLVVGAALVNKPGAPAAGCSAWSTVFPVGAAVCLTPRDGMRWRGGGGLGGGGRGGTLLGRRSS